MGNAKLYKYLDLDGGLLMLHNSNLQFTNATRLNDPFDCHPALYDFSNVPVNKKNWPPADFLIEKGICDMEYLRNRAWICSLSKVHNALLMWTYYANHKGICIGLDMEKVRKKLSRIHCGIYMGALEMEVMYRDVIEKPDYFHDDRDYLGYLLSTKAKEWEHEQEVRLVILEPSSTLMALPNKTRKRKKEIDWSELRAFPYLGGECFESLYLGIQISDEDKENCIKEARKCNPDINIYQMEPDPNAFRLKEVLI